MDVSRRRFLGVASPARRRFARRGAFLRLVLSTPAPPVTTRLKACPTGLLQRGEGGLPVADAAAAACTSAATAPGPAPPAPSAATPPRHPGPSASPSPSVAWPPRTSNAACGEACDVSAIRFRPRIGGVPLPEVDNTACNGCGACIAPCPVSAVQRIAGVGGVTPTRSRRTSSVSSCVSTPRPAPRPKRRSRPIPASNATACPTTASSWSPWRTPKAPPCPTP